MRTSFTLGVWISDRSVDSGDRVPVLAGDAPVEPPPHPLLTVTLLGAEPLRVAAAKLR